MGAREEKKIRQLGIGGNGNKLVWLMVNFYTGLYLHYFLAAL